MLELELIDALDIEGAAQNFHRDGFVCIKDAMNPEELAAMQAGANRIVEEQRAIVALEGNRGFARFSFGQQIHEPEWRRQIELPSTLPIVEAIFGSPQFKCTGGGGDYSKPGAVIQELHSDLPHFLHDPSGQTSIRDLPPPIVIINFLMCDFKKINGAIRFVPCTHRSHEEIPSLEVEPEWMKNNIVCAPAGTAVIRDVRCWHGGTANNSDALRIMTCVEYYAPWFAMHRAANSMLPRAAYDTLSERAKELCSDIVETDLSPWKKPDFRKE